MLNVVFAVISSIPALLCGIALGAVLSYLRAYKELVFAGAMGASLRCYVESTGSSIGAPFFALCWGVFIGVGVASVLQIFMQRKNKRKTTPLLLPAVLISMFIASSAPAMAMTADAISHMCDDGRFDQAVQNNRSAFDQALLAHAHTIGTMYPISSAMSACVQKLTTMISSLPNLQNPLSAGSTMNSAIINGIVGSTCEAALDSITSIQNSALNLSKICLPTPQFNVSLDLPSFNVSSCSGGYQYSTLTGFVAPPSTIYTYSQYQQ
jgi:hypothetical protein